MADRPTYRQHRNSGMWPKLFQVARPAIWLLTRPFVWFNRIADLIFDLDERGAASNLKRLTEKSSPTAIICSANMADELCRSCLADRHILTSHPSWSKCDLCNCGHRGIEGSPIGRL